MTASWPTQEESSAEAENAHNEALLALLEKMERIERGIAFLIAEKVPYNLRLIRDPLAPGFREADGPWMQQSPGDGKAFAERILSGEVQE